mmetsp:Transcript_37929/g.65000  ORF Transcript_37929/g.65000 Transcript_37929/m.65000 type:complete len:349 (+) Transcript_37929:224-1270(+)
MCHFAMELDAGRTEQAWAFNSLYAHNYTDSYVHGTTPKAEPKVRAFQAALMLDVARKRCADATLDGVLGGDMLQDGRGGRLRVFAHVAALAQWQMAHVANLDRRAHASNWLNHFHILYFEEWIETVRRLAADYTTPYFYFDPSDRPSLARINGFIDAIEARRAGHKGSHAKPRPPPRKFDLDFRGNAPPDVVDALVRRVGVYFPFTATYNGRVFEANVTASALEADGGASIGGLGGTFSGYFQKLHATQQMVLVGGGPIAGGAGPCTPNLAHGYAEADALGCLPLGPSHAFYELLLRRWMEAHGREAACALESTDRDIPADACIPFIVPLTRPRDLCDRERQAWHTYV